MGMHADHDIDQPGIHVGMDGAHRAMCCTKVTSELESIVQSPTECHGLSHNGLGVSQCWTCPRCVEWEWVM